MLSNEEAEWVTLLVNHVDGVAKLPAARLAVVSHGLRSAVANALSTRVAMQRGATERQAARVAAGTVASGGRPPTTRYAVSLGGLWSTEVLGIAAAVELVAATLKEHGAGKPPTKNSMSVGLSTKGTWWRHIDSDQGEQDLSVQRLGTLAAESSP